MAATKGLAFIDGVKFAEVNLDPMAIVVAGLRMAIEAIDIDSLAAATEAASVATEPFDGLFWPSLTIAAICRDRCL